MQEIIAPVDNIMFDIEIALNHQLGAYPLPFPGMDKSGAAICTFFMQKLCSKAGACPFRHVMGDRTVVCKHWLRGLCKKGDECEFLHEYDMSKMPECYFYSKFGLCNNKECPFLHIDPDKKLKDCPWYDRGYCRHGPNCKNRHIRRIICQCYLSGFCLEGPNCKYMHPRFDLPMPDPQIAAKKASIVCHSCGEPGHKAFNCPKNSGDKTDSGTSIPVSSHPVNPVTATVRGGFYNSRGRGGIYRAQHSHMTDSSGQGNQQEGQENPGRRPIESVTCYKCGGKGHYANKCPKGVLAFLSQNIPRADGS